MDTRCVDEVKFEAEQALKPITEVVEGLNDNLSADLEPGTTVKVNELLVDYGRRRDLLTSVSNAMVAGRAAIVALLTDGYPQEPSIEVLKEVLADLDQDLASRIAARKRFSQIPLTVEGEIEGEKQGPIS